MKESLRLKYKQIREALGQEFALKADEIIGNSLLQFIESLPYSNCIAGFFPINYEVNIISALSMQQDKIFALPALDGDVLEFRQWDFITDLTKGKFCPEPSPSAPVVAPNIIVVPCLSFDRNGHRLGYGKGFYDRTLALAKYRNTFKIGVAYSAQECKSLPIEAQDERLDAFITEREIIIFPHAKN